MTGFDIVCPGCKYQEMSYEPKAEDYGQDSVGYYCNKGEYGIERCPRAAQWRDYFKRKMGETEMKPIDKYGNPIEIGDWVCFIKSSREDCARSPWATGKTPKIEVGKIAELDANGRMKLHYKSNDTFPPGSWNSEFAFANDVVKAYQGDN